MRLVPGADQHATPPSPPPPSQASQYARPQSRTSALISAVGAMALSLEARVDTMRPWRGLGASVRLDARRACCLLTMEAGVVPVLVLTFTTPAMDNGEGFMHACMQSTRDCEAHT